MDAPAREKATRVRAMFGRIAARYDLMNSVMTFGMHGRWRRTTARAARPAAGTALDVGTGTADLAIALVKAGARRAVGIDFSRPMLLQAAAKLRGRPAAGVRLVAADALRLPFAADTFDCAVNGFVLRNVADLDATFAELLRVLKPGGRLACLELTQPPRWITPLFRPYFEALVPLAGRLVTGDAAAYRYLPDSVRPFPNAGRLSTMLRAAGFADVRYRRLGLGVVCVHSAVKPGP